MSVVVNGDADGNDPFRRAISRFIERFSVTGGAKILVWMKVILSVHERQMKCLKRSAESAYTDAMLAEEHLKAGRVEEAKQQLAEIKAQAQQIKESISTAEDQRQLLVADLISRELVHNG